uniref:CCR4-NOT transcription complex subunit 10 n=1 Tax=Ciona savignyi TaxID=51511 RepID=H2Z941_CIOSA
MNKRYELLYNRGIQLLHGGDSSSAFDCFITVAQVYHSNPRLWLRIAECCIHKCTTASENEESGKRKATNRNYSKVGIGPHRKVVITPSNLNLGRGCNMAVPSPTMEFASIASANALLIMERCMKASGCIQHTGNEVKILEDKLSDIIIACHPGHPVIGARGCQLYASVLCNSAFVALHLGNPGLAWSYSARVLTVPKLFGSHRYLAHMYAGEALVMMDRISEAIQYFQVDKINSVASTNDDGGKRSPLSDDGSNKSGNSNEDSRICKPATRQRENSRWPYPTNLPTAHSHILLNLAVCHCLRSENEKSLRLLRQGCILEQGKSPNQMVMLAVYLALSGGNIENAIEILHHNNPLINVDQSAIDVSVGSYNPEASSANHKTGAMTPDRAVKATKNEGKNKRNRR